MAKRKISGLPYTYKNKLDYEITFSENGIVDFNLGKEEFEAKESLMVRLLSLNVVRNEFMQILETSSALMPKDLFKQFSESLDLLESLMKSTSKKILELEDIKTPNDKEKIMEGLLNIIKEALTRADPTASIKVIKGGIAIKQGKSSSLLEGKEQKPKKTESKKTTKKKPPIKKVPKHTAKPQTNQSEGGDIIL